MSQEATTAPAPARQVMIDQFTAKVSAYAAGYDIPALVDDLIGKGFTDLDETPMTPFMAACARHQRREFWAR